MPRTGRGGAPGPTNAGGPTQSPEVAPGTTTYGDRQKLEEGQRAVPLADEQGGFEQRLQQTMETAQGMQRSAPGLGAPSQRPGEPLTAGLSRGRGVGPEGIPGVVRSAPNMEEARRFARFLPALEAIASHPDTSVRARNFVRMLRGSMPVDFEQDEV